MEHEVISCQQADSSSPATKHSEARQTLPAADIPLIEVAALAKSSESAGVSLTKRQLSAARLATLARYGKGGVARAVRGPDLRQAHVLMQALCEMRVELGEDQWSPSALDSRHTTTMALWRNRERALYTQAGVEQGIEDRLDAGFKHARSGSQREAAGEFKRAYLLLCCVLALARDTARRSARHNAAEARPA
nr:hypothetical protein [uncultured Cupriavidus sp.]